MRQIDNMTESEIATLYVKGMLTLPRHNNNKPKQQMPTTIKLTKRTKDADKKHSVIFTTNNEKDAEIVDTIYFKRPFIEGVKEITLTVVRDIDAKLEQL